MPLTENVVSVLLASSISGQNTSTHSFKFTFGLGFFLQMESAQRELARHYGGYAVREERLEGATGLEGDDSLFSFLFPVHSVTPFESRLTAILLRWRRSGMFTTLSSLRAKLQHKRTLAGISRVGRQRFTAYDTTSKNSSSEDKTSIAMLLVSRPPAIFLFAYWSQLLQ